jgi:hypothetical protein
MTNIELADELRKLADIYERNPEAVQPYSGTESDLLICCRSKQEFAATVKAFLPGKKEECSWDKDALIFRPTGLALRLMIHGYKGQVCTRIVVGTRLVPAQVTLAQPVTEEQIIPEHEEEIVEWKCGPFLDDGSE